MGFSSHIHNGAEVLITLTYVFVSEIKVGLFGDCYTGMSEYLAQRKNIHSIHKAAFCKIISQTVRRDFFVDTRTAKILFEISLKRADFNVCTTVLYREKIVAFDISVFKLNPSTQNLLRARREIYSPAFSALCNLCSQN